MWWLNTSQLQPMHCLNLTEPWYFTCAVYIIQGYRILAHETDNFDSLHLNYRTNSLLELGEKIAAWEIPFAIVLYVTLE